MTVLSCSDSGHFILSVLVLRLFAKEENLQSRAIGVGRCEGVGVVGKKSNIPLNGLRRCEKVIARLELGSTRRMAKVKPDSLELEM